jgi:hypothetical protein
MSVKYNSIFLSSGNMARQLRWRRRQDEMHVGSLVLVVESEIFQRI